MKCEINHCRNISDMGYYGHRICDKHWKKHCEGKINLKDIFKVEEARCSCGKQATHICDCGCLCCGEDPCEYGCGGSVNPISGVAE